MLRRGKEPQGGPSRTVMLGWESMLANIWVYPCEMAWRGRNVVFRTGGERGASGMLWKPGSPPPPLGAPKLCIHLAVIENLHPVLSNSGGGLSLSHWLALQQMAMSELEISAPCPPPPTGLRGPRTEEPRGRRAGEHLRREVLVLVFGEVPGNTQEYRTRTLDHASGVGCPGGTRTACMEFHQSRRECRSDLGT